MAKSFLILLWLNRKMWLRRSRPSKRCFSTLQWCIPMDVGEIHGGNLWFLTPVSIEAPLAALFFSSSLVPLHFTHLPDVVSHALCLIHTYFLGPLPTWRKYQDYHLLLTLHHYVWSLQTIGIEKLLRGIGYRSSWIKRLFHYDQCTSTNEVLK